MLIRQGFEQYKNFTGLPVYKTNLHQELDKHQHFGYVGAIALSAWPSSEKEVKPSSCSIISHGTAYQKILG
ncbi:hypothetical protein SCA6_002889 [Theobroma cacao]